MKKIFIFILGMISVYAFAMSDQEICQSYGEALASNNDEAQINFLTEQNSRVSSNSWTLSSEECNEQIQVGRYEYEFTLAWETWPD